MAQGDQILNSDLTEYYTLLNQVRSKASLGAIAAPQVQHSQTLSSDIKTLDDNLTNTANSIKYINKVSIGDYSQGNQIISSLDTNILSLLTNWYNTHFNDSDHSDNGDNGDDSDYTNNGSIHAVSYGDNSDSCKALCFDAETRGC